MTIAGSDSGGGAGIQADLKTFAALGVYGTSALTAITAQNTLGVTTVHELPTEMVAAQIDAIMTDIGTDAVKTGMLSSSAIIHAVVEKIREHALAQRLVVDPVMVAKGGDRLLQEEAVETLRATLIPLAAVVTPNVPEAEALTGLSIGSVADARRAAREIVRGMGARGAVVKGGHLEGPAVDVFYDGVDFFQVSAPRIETTGTHGTGCTFASAIAAYLARGRSPREAVAGAKRYVTQTLRHTFPVGGGHGPLNHFYRWWAELDRGK
jgi:hydroxymethylpyrimidine/phosphomethylpyrimidine kinase